MRTKLIVANIIALFIIILTSVTFAVTGTVELKSDVKEVKKGETFTVTLVATSQEGINGVSTKYSYDSSKLELVSESLVDSTNWSNLGTSPELTIICNSVSSIKNANIYTLKFKVKDSVATGTNLSIETTDILLDTDAQSNSEITISPRKAEIKVIENDNKNNETPDDKNNQDTSNKQEDKNNQNNSNSQDDKNAQNKQNNSSNKNNQGNSNSDKTNTNKQDATSAKNTLPQTGESNVIIYIFIIITIIILIVGYKKYKKYKDIA